MAWHGGNYYISQADMEDNALEITNYGYSQGWTKNAISAILGNMQAESGINPGIWESLTPYSGGYGLTQWTPYTKYSDWATQAGYATWLNNGPAELARISYEAANNLQWFRNEEVGRDPPMTFSEFLASTQHIYDLSNYWLWFYEHPADPGPTTQALRQTYTQNWYDFIPDPGPTPPTPGNIPIWLLFKFNDWRFK